MCFQTAFKEVEVEHRGCGDITTMIFPVKGKVASVAYVMTSSELPLDGLVIYPTHVPFECFAACKDVVVDCMGDVHAHALVKERPRYRSRGGLHTGYAGLMEPPRVKIDQLPRPDGTTLVYMHLKDLEVGSATARSKAILDTIEDNPVVRTTMGIGEDVCLDDVVEKILCFSLTYSDCNLVCVVATPTPALEGKKSIVAQLSYILLQMVRSTSRSIYSALRTAKVEKARTTS